MHDRFLMSKYYGILESKYSCFTIPFSLVWIMLEDLALQIVHLERAPLFFDPPPLFSDPPAIF